MDCIKKEISDGITLLSVNTSRFKTNEISISIAVSLAKETVCENALLINMLSRKSSQYPEISMLNKKLAYLYGAEMAATVSKIGECQVLKLGISSLDDRFSLNDESISYECVKLLTSLIFKPRFDNSNSFYQEDVDAEKRILIEKIESEENEKRTYVLRQAEALMFADEPYAINRYGDKQGINALTADDVLSAWKAILSHGKIMISVVGNTDIDKIEQHIRKAFADVNRCYSPLPSAVFVPKADSVKDKTERIEINQGKLVLGFRVNLRPKDALAPAMRVFCDVFGGGPYSKLFANVREKMSLCYYCSARYIRQKSYIIIQCGCNEDNMDKAVSEIMNQLDEIKKGNFDDEFASSKLALRDAILAVNDAPDAIENWYNSQIIDDTVKSPEDSEKENSAVTKQQVIDCASLISLDTVYRLVCEQEVQ